MKKLTILFLALATFSCNNQSDKGKNKKSTETTSQVEKSETEKSKTVNEVIRDTTITTNTQDFTFSRTENNRIIKNPDTFIGFSNFYSQFDKPLQTFTLKANEDKTIKCKEGTKITIKSNSFVTESGKSVKGDIKLKVKEYYKTSDMLLANLTTTSNTEILETGGMLYIEAFSDGEICQLKQGATIELGFPTKDRKDDMKLFSGQWNESKINWTEDQASTTTNSVETTEATAIFSIVEEMPEFQSGNDALSNYLKNNSEYPFAALNKRTEGTVFVSFIVTETGEISNVRVLRGVSTSLDKAAYYLVSNMPKWTPGKQRGEVVPVQYNLPIRFSLSDRNSELSDEAINKAKEFEKILENIQVVYANEGFSTNDKEFSEQFEKEINDINLNETDASQISRYIFSTSQLGWINCDRFIKEANPKIDYFVNLGSSDNNIDIKLVFNDINSILTGGIKEGKYIFNRVPAGHSITLVALKYENGQYYLAVTTTTIRKNGEPSLNFEPVTMAKLKTEMEKLNRI